MSILGHDRDHPSSGSPTKNQPPFDEDPSPHLVDLEKMDYAYPGIDRCGERDLPAVTLYFQASYQ
jgi:hypothetical protein